MKRIKILISCVLIIASVLSVGNLPAMAEEPTTNIYQTVVYNEYNTPIYRCYIGDAYFNYELYENSTDRYSSEAYKGLEKYNNLVIYGFSDNFPHTVEIPGVIEGKEIHQVSISPYIFISKLILPDSVRSLRIDNYDNENSDRPDYEKVYQPGYENQITSLHLGKHFSEYGLLNTLIGSVNSSYDRLGAGGFKFLQKITVSEENPNLTVVNNHLFTKDMKKLVLRPAFLDWYWGSGYEVSRYGFENLLPNLKKGSLEIGYGAFANSIVKKLEFSKHVKAIGYAAFANSYIEKITIPKTVKTIESDAFLNCNFLRKVTFEGNLKGIITNFESQKVYKNKPLFENMSKVKFYVKNKVSAKRLYKNLSKKAKNYKNIGARIYVGKKLIYKVK